MVVMRKRNRMGLKLETVFYPEKIEKYSTNADIVLFAFAKEEAVVTRNRYVNWSFQLDLAPDENILLDRTSRHTRKEIRKALLDSESYQCELQRHPTLLQRQGYASLQNEFSHRREADPVDMQRFDELAGKDMLAILYVSSPEKGILAGGAVWICEDRTYGLHSFSTFRRFSESADRQSAGTATKLLYWKCILLAKSEKSRVFDFGLAIHSRKDPHKLLHGIDELKYAFGARPVKEFDCYMAYTWKGHLFLPLLLLSKWRPLDRYVPDVSVTENQKGITA